MIEHWYAWAALAVEGVGVAVILLGVVLTTARFLLRRQAGSAADESYVRFRAEFGRAILLGLEFLVAADIIATVSADATLEGVAILAAIVAVRTFLSFTLELEITGRWPWQKRDGG